MYPHRGPGMLVNTLEILNLKLKILNLKCKPEGLFSL